MLERSIDAATLTICINTYTYELERSGVITYTDDILPVFRHGNQSYVQLVCGNVYNLGMLLAFYFKGARGELSMYTAQEVMYIDDDPNNLDPSNLIWKFLSPIEVRKGFYLIPGFSRYAINADGVVYNLPMDKWQGVYLGNMGYPMVGVTPDIGTRTIVGLHRLLALAFKPYPPNVDVLDVNHIDGVKTNYHLDNIEWCTRTYNNLHAVRNNLKSDCKALEVRDALTGEISFYHSHAEAARALNLAPQVIDDRVKSEGQLIYSDKRQYKHTTSCNDWLILDEDEVIKSIKRSGVPCPYIAFDKLTYTSETYVSKAKLCDAVCEYYKLTSKGLSYRIKNGYYEDDRFILKCLESPLVQK